MKEILEAGLQKKINCNKRIIIAVKQTICTLII